MTIMRYSGYAYLIFKHPVFLIQEKILLSPWLYRLILSSFNWKQKIGVYIGWDLEITPVSWTPTHTHKSP
jgi:hypothetical protein